MNVSQAQGNYSNGLSPNYTWNSPNTTWDSPNTTWNSPNTTWNSPNTTWNSPNTTWNSTMTMTPQHNLNMLVFHAVMIVLGVVGNILLLYCAVKSAKNCPVHLSRRNDSFRDNNGTAMDHILNHTTLDNTTLNHTTLDHVIETSLDHKSGDSIENGLMDEGGISHKLKNRVIQQNCIAFHENLAINGLVVCVVVYMPMLCNHVVGRYVIGINLCNLTAQSLEILYISRVCLYFTLSVYSFSTVVWPFKTIITKVPQVRLLSMWLWIAVVFLIIWLNVLTQSHAELNPYLGTCTILNHSSLSVLRYVSYCFIYATSLIAGLMSAVGVIVQRYRGRDKGTSSLVPALIFYCVTWSSLLVRITYKHLDQDFGMAAELVSAGAPEFQVACNPLLVLVCNSQLRHIMGNLITCVPCRAWCQQCRYLRQ